jgi:Ni/Co efflux regulator RcnB
MNCGGPGIDQPNYQIVHSYNRGENIDRDDWSRAQPVDYRAQHLRAPPRGYQWREVNGQYILAAVATGVILSVILNGGH